MLALWILVLLLRPYLKLGGKVLFHSLSSSQPFYFAGNLNGADLQRA
jgi:hypothetical protein